MLVGSAGGRRWSRSVLRIGAKRILLQHAVGPMSKREGKNDCSKSPPCSGHCARILYTFFHVIPVTLILLLTTWSTQMYIPGSKGHEKKTSVMLDEARGENTNTAFNCVNPQTGNRSLHVRGCQPRGSNSGKRQILISGVGDLSLVRDTQRSLGCKGVPSSDLWCSCRLFLYNSLGYSLTVMFYLCCFSQLRRSLAKNNMNNFEA